jgi:hypothetical protein
MCKKLAYGDDQLKYKPLNLIKNFIIVPLKVKIFDKFTFNFKVRVSVVRVILSSCVALMFLIKGEVVGFESFYFLHGGSVVCRFAFRHFGAKYFSN